MGNKMMLRLFFFSCSGIIPALLIMMNVSCNEAYHKGRSVNSNRKTAGKLSKRQLNPLPAHHLRINPVAFKRGAPVPPFAIYLKTIPPDRQIAVSVIREGRSMMDRSDCYSCHGDYKTLAAPSYIDISRKYKNDPEAITRLARVIISGGRGVWEDREMKSHPELLEEDAQKMVWYILSLSAKEHP